MPVRIRAQLNLTPLCHPSALERLPAIIDPGQLDG
jgi:hypothetical protein